MPQASNKNTQTTKSPHRATSIRLNHYLAERGLASRREADELIRAGKIFVNGKQAKLGMKVGLEDAVEVRGLKKEHAYIAYHKPLGLVTIGAQAGEKAIPIETIGSGLFPLGRLDKDSSGLIILTNDRRLPDRLLTPASNHEKEYRVVVNRKITNTLLRGLKEGVRISKGEFTRPAKVRKVDEYTFDIILTEGKNRQIRRMCKAFGYEVRELTRFRIMNILLGDLRPGEYRKLESSELKTFLANLKLN